MNLKKVAAIFLWLASSCAFAEQTTEYEPSDAVLKQSKINMCESSAETAKNIARATIKAKKFDATPEVIAQTEAGSSNRKIMQQLFERGGLMSNVLIVGANFGASKMPDPDGQKVKKDIEELTYWYVRSRCISASLAQ